MVAPTPRAEVLLKYPVYASDFDLRNDNYLIVGGGGGEGRSGVGNKIVRTDVSLHNAYALLASIGDCPLPSTSIACSLTSP